jgi:hypothetical protein
MQVTIAPFDDPDTPSVYANMTGVGTTGHDVVVLFAQAVPLGGSPLANKVTLKPLLRVTMSPEAARHLVGQLGDQLRRRDEALARHREALSEKAT